MSRLLGCVLWVLFPTYLVTRNSSLLAFVPPLTGLELLLQAISVLLPGIATVRLYIRQRGILWRLWPLWRALTEAVPNVTLPGSGFRRVAPAASMATLQWRVYRLVIEIRDAGLTLRAYATPATVSAAQQFATERRIPVPDSDAATVACWLEVARRAKLNDRPPRATVSDITGPGGSSLHEEIEFLVRVAHFHATTLPAEFIARHPAEVS
jgi:hypothetical protein